jgi:hypothetical protein
MLAHGITLQAFRESTFSATCQSYGVILIAAHRQREDVSRLASNPVTNIAPTLALLPTMGIMGAAIG